MDDQVGARGYGSPSEYVRELIRKGLDRQRLRDLVLEGAASPRAGFADAEYFARGAEEAPEAQRRVTRDGTPTVENLRDAVHRNLDAPRQLRRGHAERFEVFAQSLAGMDRFTHDVPPLDGNPRFPRRSGRSCPRAT